MRALTPERIRRETGLAVHSYHCKTAVKEEAFGEDHVKYGELIPADLRGFKGIGGCRYRIVREY